MARMDPAAAAQKYVERTASATRAYTDGVNSVSEAPGPKAAAQAQVATQNYSQAITSGRWAAKLNAVSLAEWKAASINKGAQRYASGTAAAASKMQRAFQTLFPHIQQVRASLPPRGTKEQNMQRALQFMQGMSQYKQ